MPISYEDLEEGRRRKWDKLKDPEARKAEERAQREADPEARKKMSAYQRRLNDRTEERELEQAKWRKTKRDVIIIAVAFVAFVVTVLGVQYAIDSAISSSRQERFQEFASIGTGDEPFAAFGDPVQVWASWRNAWWRRDASAIFRTYSPGMADRERGSMTGGGYISHLERMLRTGGRESVRDIARQFRNPIIVHYPSGNPDEGDLAVLKTRPVVVDSIPSKQAREWVLAIVWLPVEKEWRVHELRAGTQWNDDWTEAKQIAPLRRSDE